MEWSLNFLLCLLSLKQRERARERVRKSPCRLLKIACLGIPVWTLVLLGSQNIRLNFKRKVGTPVSSLSLHFKGGSSLEARWRSCTLWGAWWAPKTLKSRRCFVNGSSSQTMEDRTTSGNAHNNTLVIRTTGPLLLPACKLASLPVAYLSTLHCSPAPTCLPLCLSACRSTARLRARLSSPLADRNTDIIIYWLHPPV